jgi:hypothetical protein
MLLFALFLILPVAICLARPAAEETRVALVIGINAYQNAPPLTNPLNDAQAIGDALRRLNFEVEELHDPDFRTLTRGLRDFGIRAQRAETALVYYAGHGVQVDRENYLIPADAKLERARDLEYEALPLSLMLDEVSQASKIGIILLDSCRNNPFIDRVARSMSTASRAVATTPGMARVDNVPRNTIVVMAAKADQVAEDGQGHSPFAAAILAHFQTPGLELGLFFRSVRDTVLKATQNRQEPYVFSSLGAEPFYFYPRPPNRPPLIGPIPTLHVVDTNGPTPLGIPTPTDPDLDPLTVRIVGLPRSGEVRVEGRRAALGEAFSTDHFMAGTFKPDGTMFGPIGTLDILVEDGRGGSAMGSLPIIVLPSSQPPAAAAKQLSPATSQATAPVLTSPEPTATKPLATAPSSTTTPSPSPTALSLGGSFSPGTSIARTAPGQPSPSLAAPPDLAEARTLALSVPCALIDVREAQSPSQPARLLVSGPTLPGAAFDSFIRQIEAPGRAVGVATEPLDPGHCAALAVMTDLVRRSREQRALRLIAPPAPVPIGGQLAVAAETIPHGALYVDLYAADGSVQHLRRGTVAGIPAGTDVTIAAAASGPPGQRLLVAITTAAPLNLEQRPATESETAYLPALQRELARMGGTSAGPQAEVATLSIVAAPRPVAVSSQPPPTPSAASRAANPSNPRCEDIVARVRLGETLSDADRATLRTGCGR